MMSLLHKRSKKPADGRLKPFKVSFLYICKWLGLFWLARWVTQRGVRILCYHGIWLEDENFAGDAMFMARDKFERRLEILKRLRYPVVPLSAAVDFICGTAVAPSCPVVITIDDGWYSSFVFMFSALKRHGMPVTLYCDTANLQRGWPVVHVMADYVRKWAEVRASEESLQYVCRIAHDSALPIDQRLDAVRAIGKLGGINADAYLDRRVFNYMTPDELKDAAYCGVDVQLHTHRHTMHDLSPEKLRQEITENRQELARTIECDAQQFQHFCYPSGVASELLVGVLDSLHIKSSTTTQQGIAWPGTNRQLLPRILDGSHLHAIEFEAELSGFSEFIRPLAHARKRLSGH